jgi:chromate transporter
MARGDRERPAMRLYCTGVEPTARVSLPRLASTFLRIGALAFGGLGATLALIESHLVERQRVLSRAELTEALTYTKLLPGSTVVQVVAYLGWRLGGWPTSAVATLAFLAPSAAMMIALAYGFAGLGAAPTIGPMLRGLLAVVVGLLAVATYRLARPNVQSPLATSLAVGAFLAGLTLRLNPAWIVVAAGLVGLLAARRR